MFNRIIYYLRHFGNLPNEIIIKILYEYNGLQHPIAKLILKQTQDLGYFVQSRLNSNNIIQYDIPLQKWKLERSKKILQKKKCPHCNYCWFNRDGIWFYNTIKPYNGNYNSWTNILRFFEYILENNLYKKYGQKYDKYFTNNNKYLKFIPQNHPAAPFIIKKTGTGNLSHIDEWHLPYRWSHKLGKHIVFMDKCPNFNGPCYIK